MTVRYRVDPGPSRFTVQAFATGLLSAFAHSPTFAVRTYTGEAEFPESGFQNGRLVMTVRADSLERRWGMVSRPCPRPDRRSPVPTGLAEWPRGSRPEVQEGWGPSAASGSAADGGTATHRANACSTSSRDTAPAAMPKNGATISSLLAAR